VSGSLGELKSGLGYQGTFVSLSLLSHSEELWSACVQCTWQITHLFSLAMDNKKHKLKMSVKCCGTCILFHNFSTEKSSKLKNSCFYPTQYPSNYGGKDNIFRVLMIFKWEILKTKVHSVRFYLEHPLYRAAMQKVMGSCIDSNFDLSHSWYWVWSCVLGLWWKKELVRVKCVRCPWAIFICWEKCLKLNL
jgi:hypothetical protein